MNEFAIKDGGKREQLAGGMVRDTEDGKTDYTLITDGPMFDRWAEHLTKAAMSKYGRRNWMKAASSDNRAEIEATMDRFKRSAFRHFRKWQKGEYDEDHAAALFFNVNGYEFLREVLQWKDTAESATLHGQKSCGIPQACSLNAGSTEQTTCKRHARQHQERKFTTLEVP